MGMLASAMAIVAFAGLGPPRDDPVGARAGEERTVGGIKLCWCPPGKFTMGSPPEEPDRRPDEDQVEVTLTRGFWTGKYEVTQGEWKRVVGKLPGKPTAELPEGDDLPGRQRQLRRGRGVLPQAHRAGRQVGELPEGWEFRLPTEAQWEYACRAGTTTATAFGDTLSTQAGELQGQAVQRGPRKGRRWARRPRSAATRPNAWGIHDMHGNTFEWCRDWYHAKLPGGDDPDLYEAKATTPEEPGRRRSRGSRRGGAWTDDG